MTQSSYLETIPAEVLRHIAFLCAASATLGPPHDFLQLLLTSRQIYFALSIDASPDVYANLFRSSFDTAAIVRRFPSFSSSSVTVELVRRFQTMRRIRHRCISVPQIRSDLWTAYLMMLENDGLNLSQLLAAGIVPFLLEVIRGVFQGNHPTAMNDLGQSYEIKCLSLWLLWLTASRGKYKRFKQLIISLKVARSRCSAERNFGGPERNIHDHTSLRYLRTFGKLYTCFATVFRFPTFISR